MAGKQPEWYESNSVTKYGGQPSTNKWTSRSKHVVKESGSYKRFTAKEKTSTGQQFVERSTKRVGYKESNSVTKYAGQSSTNQWTSRSNHVVKESGSYERFTAIEKRSSGQQFVERSTVRVAYKYDYQRSGTFKVGDKSGYTECYYEQKVRRVNYDDNNYITGKAGPKLKPSKQPLRAPKN